MKNLLLSLFLLSLCMTFIDSAYAQPSNDPYEILKGRVTYISSYHAFGKNPTTPITYEVVSSNGFYRTPQVADSIQLRIKAGSANDTALGTGAREITITGLNELGNVTTESLATAGTSASALSNTTWFRVFKITVTESGTYANPFLTGSHAAEIILETSGGVEWTSIPFDTIGAGESQSCAYTVPSGYKAAVIDYIFSSDTDKDFQFLFTWREGVMDAAAPYKAAITIAEGDGSVGGEEHKSAIPDTLYPELTDIIAGAKTSVSTAAISCHFEVYLTTEDL